MNEHFFSTCLSNLTNLLIDGHRKSASKNKRNRYEKGIQTQALEHYGLRQLSQICQQPEYSKKYDG